MSAPETAAAAFRLPGAMGWAAAALAVAATVAGTAAAVVATRDAPGRMRPVAGLAATSPLAPPDAVTGMDRAADVPRRAQEKVDRAVATLRRYALNLLLVPVLDDDMPPRWAEPGLNFTCLDGGTARMDGRPVVVGERLPSGAFVLERDLSSCRIFDSDSLDVTGSATLHVIPDDVFGLTAVVALEGLRIRGEAGAIAALDERFAARAGDASGPASQP